MTSAAAARILVVEDQPLLAMVIAGLLDTAGLTSEQAEHGAAAVEKLRTGQYDLVVTDLMMPEMDGVELVRWIREEAALTVPVVVLSANTDAGYTERLQQLGVSAVLKKPLDMDHFVDHVLQCLAADD